jgi:hypothetical protein
MPNWKKIVSSSNAKQYRWPAGWQTREQVAEDLECSRDRVAEVLAPAIEQGLIERKQFPVWDVVTHRKIMVTGYREIPRDERKSPAESREKKEPHDGAKVRRKRGSGKIGVLSKEGKKWKITWPHCPPTFPTERVFNRDLEIL